MNEAIREQLSAYVDGELPDNEAELLIRRMSQDAELRNAAAEYLALGRLMRDEAGIAAADRLRDRVAAELDESSYVSDDMAVAAPAARKLRPLAGVAIAASVALVGIFALQFSQLDSEPAADTTVVSTPPTPVPQRASQQELQREMLLRHADATSDLGANGMDSRLIALEFEEALEVGYVETDADDEATDADQEADEQR